MVASSYAEYYGGGTTAGVIQNGAKTGEIVIPLIIGDDYLESNNRSLDWIVAIPSGTTVAGSTCRLTFVKAAGCYSFDIVFTGTVTLTGSDATLSFDMPSADTSTVIEGEYFFFVEWLGDAGEQITKIFNRQLVNWKNKAA